MELQVQKREKFGRQVKSLRQEGLIPAELYGHGIANEHISVSAKDFAKALKTAGENTIVNIVLNGEKRPVLIYDVKKNYITNEFLSVDFYQVRMDEKITARIPVLFNGESAGVKAGGILIKVMQEIEVEALPSDLPKNIEVDLSALDEIGKSFMVKDLKPIKGVEFLVEPQSVIVTVKEFQEEKAPEVAAPTVEAAAPAAETAAPEQGEQKTS